MTLYDILTLNKGFDCVCDTTGNTCYFELSRPAEDNYDQFLQLITQNITPTQFIGSYMLECNFHTLICQHQKVWEEFAKKNCEISPAHDTTPYDKYYTTFRIMVDMVNGNYSERQYKEFLDIFYKN